MAEITQAWLKRQLKKDIKRFQKNDLEITDDTKPEDVFDPADGFGPSSPKNIVQGAILWTLRTNGYKKSKFPNNWVSLTVAEIAAKLLPLLLLMLLSFSGKSQLQVSLGAIQTDLKNNAIKVGVKYLQSLDSIWQQQNFIVTGKHSFFLVMPDINVETGTQDAFSSINVKATALLASFKTETVEAVVTPDLDRAFQTFPFSLGIETNNLFSYVNGIVEAGWVPWYQSKGSSAFIKHTKMGLFLQGGYKFYVDSSKGNGGQVDESSEPIRGAIFRAKGSFGISSGAIIRVGGFKIGIAGDGDAWYDFMNGEIYHRLSLAGRIFLNSENYFDFGYENGSGAPTFNKGSQWGVGLTVTF
jgi:hypothetical protein